MDVASIRWSCCVTGHRDILPEKTGYIRQMLGEAVGNAMENGYTHFISGFAEGADQMFAAIVTDLKRGNPALTLEAALPYPERIQQLRKGETAAQLLSACDTISVVSNRYFQGCYAKRNQFMIDKSGLVIAVFDGREKGGTAATIRYAHKQKRIVQVVSIASAPEQSSQ